MEAGLFVLLVLGLATVSFVRLVPGDTVLVSGAILVVFGMLLGVPTGALYHVALYRALRPRGPLPARWWVAPLALHPRLEARERRRVMPWFWLGATGFVLTCLGCLLVAIGALRS